MFEEYSLLNSDDDEATIDMGPLIDMVFILLIFFIITTNFNRQTGVDVSKPKASSVSSFKSKTVLVGITNDGTIHVFGRQVSLKRLQSIVKQEIQKNPESAVVIVADQKASIGKAVEVMDNCYLAGASKVSIAADNKQ